MSDRLRVGVILGGRSSEREISLETSRHVVHSLDRGRYEALPIFMDSRGRLWVIGLNLLVQNTTRDIEDRLEADANRLAYEGLRDAVDFVYIGLHGKYGEDGCLQGMLELIDVPYSGSGVLGSALGMDKTVQRRLLAAAGIDVPRHRVVAQEEWHADEPGVLAAIVEDIALPVVVKPAREGCSTGLAVATSRDELAAAFQGAFAWDSTALAEELLVGTEVTVTVLQEEGQEPRAFPATETPAKEAFLTVEEKFLPGHGQNITPARLSGHHAARVAQTAVDVFRILGLTAIGRIDMFVTGDGRVVVGEPNTLPGSTPSSTVFLGPMEEGIPPRELLSRIVEASRAAHANKKGPLG